MLENAKYNENDLIKLEVDLSFNEDWENEDDLNKLAKKYGYELIEIYEVHGPGGGAAVALAESTIKNFVKNDYLYEKNGNYFETATDEEII